ELRTGKEQRLDKGGLVVAQLAFSADGSTIYATAGTEDDPSRSDIYALTNRAPRALTAGPGHKVAPVAARGGSYLVYQVSPRGVVPQRPGAQGLAQRASAEQQQVVVHNLQTGQEWAYPGTAPVVADD